MQKILEHSISVAGGIDNLANAVGCTSRSIYYWRKTGVPVAREFQMRALYGKRKPKAGEKKPHEGA